MIKLVLPGAWNWDEPVARLVKVSSRGLIGDDLRAFVKRAGHDMVPHVGRLRPGEEGLHLTALGSTEYYGCFFAGAPVQTSNGCVPIEQVQVGDQVLTHGNRYRPVTHTFARPYAGRRVSLKVASLPEPVVSTANHPFWVVRRKDFGVRERCDCWIKSKGLTKQQAVDNVMKKAEFASAESLGKGDYLVLPINPDAPVGEARWLEDRSAYLMGVYLAEGCIAREYRDLPSKGKARSLVFVMSTEKDGPVLERMREAGWWLGTQPSNSSELGMRVLLSSNDLAGDCEELFGSSATTKRLHPALFIQSTAWKLRFLAGYFDGDGCVVKSGQPRYRGVLRANTASLNLALDIQRMLAGLGIPCSLSKSFNRVSNGCFGKQDNVIYEISVGSAYSARILEHCARLQRPDGIPERQAQASMQIGTEYALFPINSVAIDDVTDEVKYNLEVEEDNTYVVFTTVHNSNRNGDGFRDAANRKFHDTFEKYAHYFRNHANKAHNLRYGRVIKSAYHDPMRRVELLIGLFGTKEAAERDHPELGRVADRELDILEKKAELAHSMACSVEHDVCSGCGNKARSRAEYCTAETCPRGGLRDNITKVAADGHILHADNPEPRFFDISHVFRPADRIAYAFGMLKAAHAGPVSGAELAEAAGLVEASESSSPSALKVAEQIALCRELAAAEEDSPPRFLKLAAAARPPVRDFPDAPRGDVYRALADAHVVLPVAAWLGFEVGDLAKAAEAAPEVEARLPGVYARLAADPDLPAQLAAGRYEPAGREPATRVRDWAFKLAAAHGLDRACVVRRAQCAIIHALAPSGSIKSAGESPGAEAIARQYALYKLAFLRHVAGKFGDRNHLTTALVHAAS